MHGIARVRPAGEAPRDPRLTRLGDEPPWWRSTTVYQIYPRSFMDASGDGIGDLPGLLGRLDYLQDLGVETLWLSPFYDSPQADFGYDIRDHFDVAAEYGSLDDVRRLVDEVHARGMKIVFDMVLNHTSDEHPWFVESRRSRRSPKRDWYLWREGRRPGGGAPPNNWKSMLGGSGWHYDERTREWYWASFLGFQPDLNYRNPAVKREMLGVVRHWLEAGADGLRLDIFNALFKDESFEDNPFSFRPIPSEDDPDGFFQRAKHTIDHPDTFAFARELRVLVDGIPGPPRFLVGEVFGSPRALRRYCGERDDGLHLVFLFKTLRTAFSGPAVRALVEELEREFAEPLHPTYVFGNHDRPRSIHRLGDHAGRAKLMATLQLTARGVPFIYYGEEIGMPQHSIALEHGKDPVAARFRFVPDWLARPLRRLGISMNRDECRLPMAWDDGPNGGFSSAAETWLPPHPLYESINVQTELRDPGSILHCYRRLLALRRATPALHAGTLELLGHGRGPSDVVAYRRAHATGAVDVLLNFAEGDVTVPVGRAGRAVLFSTHVDAPTRAGRTLHLRAHEGVILAR